MHYYTSYMTTAETIAEYRKLAERFERQRKYERNIVRSVPEESIAVSSAEPMRNERWEPG